MNDPTTLCFCVYTHIIIWCDIHTCLYCDVYVGALTRQGGIPLGTGLPLPESGYPRLGSLPG